MSLLSGWNFQFVPNVRMLVKMVGDVQQRGPIVQCDFWTGILVYGVRLC
jgi:hypothetical protein